MARKKVCLLICSSLLEFPSNKLDSWLRQIPELNIIADVEPVLVFGGHSADITPEAWLKAATEIHRRLTRYAGFVVIHGVDNLLYTASALSFLIQNLTRPVIFTGWGTAPTTGRDVDIKANLINAIQVATNDFTEVCLMFGNRLLRANQAADIEQESLNAFQTPLHGILGRIDFSVRIFDKGVARNRGKAELAGQLNQNINRIDYTPGLSVRSLTKRSGEPDGLIVNAGEYHQLPEALVDQFERGVTDVPVVIWAPEVTAPVLTPSHLIVVTGLTWPATLTKFMWALGQTKNAKQLKALMAKNVAGELTSS